MLQLKKYQRFFYAIIALFVMGSLISVGTFRSTGDAKWKSAQVFKTPRGRSFARWQLEQLEQFISCESLEENPLNDGVLSTDFLNSPLTDHLLSRFPALIEGDLLEKWHQECKWRPYRHPHLEYLNQESLWKYFSPDLATKLKEFRTLKVPEQARDLFKIKRALFNAQNQIPQERLRRIIWQQQQVNPNTVDPLVTQQNFDLFGHTDLRSWFGPHYVRLAAQVILLGAETAEQQQLSVTDQEVMADLLARAARCWKLMRQSQASLEPAALRTWLRQLNHQSGLSEADLIVLWRRVLLFRRWACSHRQRWSLDASAPIAFGTFASAAKQVRFLTLDKSLCVSDLPDWEHFEIYCRIVSKDATTSSALPRNLYSAKELLVRAPQLLQAKCRVRHIIISRDRLRAQIPAKEVLQWLLEDKNWQSLCDRFPKVNRRCISQSTRAQSLELLSDLERGKVDEIARSALSSARPQELDAALQGPGEELEFSLNAAGLDLPYPFLENKAQLVDLIWRARSGDAAAEKALLNYSEDDQHILSLRVLQCSDWEPLTWQQAKAQGAVQAFLNANFSDANTPKTETPFAAKFKSKEAEKQFGLHTFDLDATKRVAKEWANKHYPGKAKVWQLMRQIQTLEQSLQELRRSCQQSVQIRPCDQVCTFWNQWSLIESKCRIERADSKAEIWPELFTSDREWSSIHWERSCLGFYQLLKPETQLEVENIDHQMVDPSILDGLERIRAQIAEHLDSEMVDCWMQKQAIHLVPIYPTRDSTNGDST